MTGADNLVGILRLSGFEFHEIKRNDETESTKDLNATSDEQTASEREGGEGKRREKDASRFPSLGKLNPPRRSGAELGASFVASLE